MSIPTPPPTGRPSTCGKSSAKNRWWCWPRGDLQRLILTSNVFRLLRLEGCLSGKVPKGAKPIPGPCAELARSRPVEFVAGPATFLNEAVIQIDRQLSRLAARVPPDQLREFLLTVAARYGITSFPSIGNPDFLATVVFDLRRARGTPKARLAYLFPNGHSAQIVLRLRPDLSDAERHRALGLIREAVDDTTPRQVCAFQGKPAPCFALHGGRYVVSGAPVVVDGLARALKDALLVLFAVAVAVMALTLVAIFRSRFRLLPLGIALAAAGLTFGLLGLAGGSLTMASIAVLPILIGLAVDYAIQLQARYDEAVEEGAAGAEAARQAAARGGPTIGTACLATAAGFLALQLSPTPMVRSFGLLLVVGIAIAFSGRIDRRLRCPEPRGRWERCLRGRSPRAQDTAEWRKRTRPPGPHCRSPLGSPTPPARARASAWPSPWSAGAPGTQIETASEIRQLAPQSLPAVRDLTELQDATGVSGELDVRIEAPDLTDPATLRWMAAFKRRVLSSNGFTGPNPSCLDAEVCPGPALSDFLTRGGGRRLTQGTSARPWRNCPPTTCGRSPRSTRRQGCPATRRCSASASAPSRWKTSRR